MNSSEDRVWVLSGEDFQRLERMNELLEKYIDKATKDFNFDIIRPEDFSFERFAELIVTFPMMAEKRVVLLRDFDKLCKSGKELKKSISGLLMKTPDSTIVIIEGEEASLAPKPKNYCRFEEFKPVYENKLPGWIKERFLKKGKKIEEKAVALLINNAGTILGELNSEIEKVLIICGEKDIVAEKDVSLVVGSFRRDTVYSLCNAVGLGSFGDAIKILANLTESEKNKETYYISTLFSHILRLGEYNRLRQSGLSKDEVLKTLSQNLFIWNLNSMDKQALNFNSKQVKKALTALAKTESSLKKSGIDNKLILELAMPFIIPKNKAI